LGRHKDPETLAFLGKLKEKGESLGYKTAEEVPMAGGLYFADLTWQLAENQPPLVTFEVETEESLRVLKNTAKYFETVSKEVPKPFRHFIIVVKGRLSEGIRRLLQPHIEHYNVSLFEDIVNDTEAARVLFEELDGLKVHLSELVARCLSSGQIDQTFQDLRLGIQEGMPKFLAEPENITIEFGSKDQPDPLRPFKFQVSAKTPAGEPTLIQRMYDASKTGEPVRITKKDEIKVQIPGHEADEIELVEIRPEAIKGTLARLETPNYSKFIELILTIESEDDQIKVVSNVSQHAPWKVALKLHKRANQLEFSVNFDSHEGDPYQFVYFVEFFQQAKRENRLICRVIADGKVVLDAPFAIDIGAPPEDWMKVWRALAEIQNKTGVRLPIPKKMSDEDLKEIGRLYTIVTKGEIGVQLNFLTVNFSKEQAEQRLELARHPDVIENFQANIGQHAELFGTKIPLGEARLIVPKARINLAKLHEDCSRGIDPISTEVSALPDRSPKIVYRKWMTTPQGG
jgi:hypothetical protein